ncbi:hypothetical protein L5G28_07470 [Gordonia sp. HY285]|uniref:hypothetical protein n=1 Tax=Gordonia liuliyuniae TaxID=2911517 RepID=UPI001F1A53CA|nr:hypothetical protein [Gordonia liuliyuniae]MCF8609999.1 hypothetical protein [Gordonia liuliyuniae]
MSFPEGSHEVVSHSDDGFEETYLIPVEGWAPPGWRPEGNYVELVGTREFVWPTTRKVYHSRSTAKNRADLLESYGATAVIERSNPIIWPDTEAP